MSEGLWRVASWMVRPLWPLVRGRGEPLSWRQRWYGPDEPLGAAKDLWVHTASYGEVAPYAPLLAELAEAGRRIGVTVTSGRSYEAVANRLATHAEVRWLPLPGSPYARRLAGAWRPRRLVLLEAELWPHLAAVAPEVRILGGRLSGAPRFRGAWALRERLAAVYVAGEAEARPYRRLGMPATRFHLGFHPKLLRAGNPPAIPAAYRSWRRPGARHLVVGSLHPEEVPVLAPALGALVAAGWRLLIVPRHVARVSELARLLDAVGLASATWPKTAAVTVVDEMGVLAGLYGLADVALVGGSWFRWGGHDPVEPLAHGVPVVLGPHCEHQGAVLAALPAEAWRVAPVTAVPEAVATLAAVPASRRTAWRTALRERAERVERLAREALA